MKSTIKTVLLILFTSVITLEMSFAQGRGGGRPPHGPPRGGGIIPGGGEDKPPLPPLMDALDQDLDGDISADELREASEALKKLDTDNNGKLTEDELKPERPQGAPEDQEEDRPRRRRHVPPVMKALDTDGNGEISEQEIGNAAESLAQLDHNQDGKLSKMETRPSRRFKPKQPNRD